MVVALVGVLLLLTGVAQLTLWKPPATLTQSLSVPPQSSTVPLTVLEVDKLGLTSPDVKLSVSGPGKVLIAQGRSDDVSAWAGNTPHYVVDSSDAKAGTVTMSVKGDTGAKGTADPTGSDLWQSQVTGNEAASISFDPTQMSKNSILIASDGVQAAPASTVQLSYANDATTPWALPLIVIGAIVFLVGLIWLLLEVSFAKNSKSGRRSSKAGAAAVLALLIAATGSAMTMLTPDQAQADESSSPSAPASGQQSSAAPSSTTAPSSSSSPSSTASSTAATPSQSATSSEDATASNPSAAGNTENAVVNEAQFHRIMTSVATTVKTADAGKNVEQLAVRAAGQELALRSANYKIRASVANYDAREPIDGENVKTQVISTDRQWPRTFIAVTQGKDNSVPQVLRLVQQSPRENYKVTTVVRMLPGQTLPAAQATAVNPVSATSTLASTGTPNSVASTFATLLTNPNGEDKSKFKDSSFVTNIAKSQAAILDKNKDATIDIKHVVDANSVFAFPTSDNGTVVIATVTATVKGTPKGNGNTFTLDDKGSATLAGGDKTTNGYEVVSGESVVLFIPAGTGSQVNVVGADSGLLSAKLL